ncbi:MFS transporter [Alicyclobacillus cycloheptanicus]|uniref:GPH family glycoside/pentoside/hexuronide:cation symporter n=1 Tax=Alicyclobacillus cycloheptanicus TaxID=1457 RepID=A0ABT9XN05_9BACL|nr:MFS transporter [Alicyclobacillus cycloheptanicus]MDQ0191118.1 GPH family glycoside/pentoside/hexuronide:cation symporter [Alicyclobacillus cycloheptanicus]WDM02745.1 MFS transporter [Alicyclobacillus cycloheptanicus]
MRTGRMISYSAGNVGASMLIQAFSAFAYFYYVDQLKVPDEWISTALVIHGIFNAVLNPLSGQLSDRTRSRLGRRLPWMLGGMVPLAIVYVLIWTPLVPRGHLQALLVYFFIVVLLYDIFYVFVVLNWTSLFPELFHKLRERSVVSAWRQMFGIIGMIVGVALPPVIYKTYGWTALGLIFGIVGLISFLAAVWGAWNPRDTHFVEAGLPLGKALSATFRNPAFVFYVIGSFFFQLAFQIIPGAVPFFGEYVLHASGAAQTYMLGAMFIVAIPMVYVWSAVTNRIGPRNAVMTSGILFAASLIGFWFVSSSALAIMWAGVLGLSLAGLMILLDVLLSDVIDEDHVKTGTPREGMYFGVQGFIVRWGVSLNAVLTTTVLNRSHYVAGAAHQAPTVATGIHFLMSFAPMISVLIAVAAFVFYPLRGQRLAAVKARLAEMEAEA